MIFRSHIRRATTNRDRIGATPLGTSERIRRIAIILAYVVATMWAQGGHDDGYDTESETQCLADCRDARPHVTGHPSADLAQERDECAACQLRSNLIATSADARSVGSPKSEPAAPTRRVRTVTRTVRIPSCRAPPLV